MNIEHHLLNEVTFLESPNFNERPKLDDIRLIIIHSICLPPKVYGEVYVEDFFLNKLSTSDHVYFEEIKDLKVSSHLYIKRNGELIQFVPFNKRAWHAGESSYKGVIDCNNYSIGIELEGTDDDEFTRQQYQRLKEVLICLLATYPRLNSQAIVGHSDIAPGRKTDPGPKFDWQQIKF